MGARCVCWLAFLAACGHTPPVAAPEPDEVREPATLAVAAAGPSGPMHRRLDRLTLARDAVIRADLDGARAAMQGIADDEDPTSSPDSWRIFLDDLREATSRGSLASDLGVAASAVAEGGAACGGCHQSLGVAVVFVDRPLPDGRSGMARHAWAADRLWEGLLAADPARWRAAVDALQHEEDGLVPLTRRLPIDRVAAASTLHHRVHALGETAALAQDTRSRAEVVGAMLRACAECHTLMRTAAP